MPTYAYACTACDHRFEAQQSFTESSLTICPECAGRLRKVFPSVGVVFKGSGFYRNDSRSTNHGKINAGSTTSHGDSNGSSDSGSSSDASTSAGTPPTPAATPTTPAAASSGTGASSGAKSKVAASSGASTST